MAVKKGGIYKVKGKAKGYFAPEINNHVMVVVEINEKKNVVTMINEHVSVEADLSEVQLTSTKIKPELRQGLKELYQLYTKKKKIEDQLKKLESERLSLSHEMSEKRKDLLKYSPVITLKTIENIIESRWFYSKDGEKFITVGIGFDIPIEKYANPESYGFLMREYDNTIHIWDKKQAIKECKINIDHCRDEVNQIKSIANSKKLCKLTAIKDDVYLGDKDWLITAKIFEIEIAKNANLEQLEAVLKQIVKLIQTIEAKAQRKQSFY